MNDRDVYLKLAAMADELTALSEAAETFVGEAALRTAGASQHDIVRTRLFLTDIARDWAAVGAAHGTVFADIRPAATMVQVGALIDPRLLVEIEVTAIIPEFSAS